MDEPLAATAISVLIYRWQTYKRSLRLQNNTLGINQADTLYGKPLRDFQGFPLGRHKTIGSDAFGIARVQRLLDDKLTDIKLRMSRCVQQHKSTHLEIDTHTERFSKRLSKLYAHDKHNMSLCITNSGRLGE